MNACDLRGHVTLSLQVEMELYVGMEEARKYFSPVKQMI